MPSAAHSCFQGSIEQKLELLPKMAALEYVGCWALTEPNYGSDAASLATTAEKANILLSQNATNEMC